MEAETKSLPADAFQMPTIAEPPKFELESYIANYRGRTRLHRLYFIGTRSKFLATEALRLAVKEAKSGRDVEAYRKATEALSRVSGEEDVKTSAVDMRWIEKTTRQNELEAERLESELRGYKNNLIKESIRMGYQELATLYYETGDLDACIRACDRLRDHCTTTQHVLARIFTLIIVHVDRQAYPDARAWLGNLNRADESIPDSDTQSKSKVRAATGLYYLLTKQYGKAASFFLSCDPALGSDFAEVLTINDVAIYGTLCALATMDRHEIRQSILNNPVFQKIIEEEPHLRQAVKFFCASKFQSFFEILEAYKVDYLLDIHLSSHVAELYKMIRIKAMQQYIVPFSKLKIDSLRSALYDSKESEEDAKAAFKRELFQLISSGTLDARLDLENDVLYVGSEAHGNSVVYGDVLRNARDFINQMHMETVHMNMTFAEMEVVKPPPAKKTRSGLAYT
ncbi:hypothetical protein KEM56_006659 [Ascosphaera pollenicola]|nr:hypothetical protein KEM56_006659 [Ascosphaera pollenicola]